ncbi:glycosyltransferase family 4 protein [Vibrio splendidus]|uniref:glycosyltransferase family 4 protein n=1 Tax=Vibrio splendidus TaxID=29497 RepID=UPI000C861598|nr:glycosyltransferase family 4 protein [Vibrio splendidus]PMO23510.1 hypothetical protein BCT15_02435 [Vibrio splendidus]
MSKIVLHIHQKFLPYQGGSTQRLLNLIQDATDEYEHIVICENSEKVDSYSEVGRIRIYRYDKYSQIPSILLKIKKTIKINIVHYHNYRPAFWGSVSKLIFPKAKTLFELHSVYVPTTLLGRFLTKFIHKICDQGLVLSESSVSALKERSFTKPISVIYNGVDITKFRDAPTKNGIFSSEGIIVGYIGSIEAFQGVDSFCKIAKQVKDKRNDITFVVVGGDKNKHNILKKISGDTVDFYEFFPPELVPSIYKMFNCLLMTRPSLPETESAVPLKPIEALGSNIPVISTKVGGMVELKCVLDSKNIQLFDTVEEIESYLVDLEFENLRFNKENKLAVFDVKKQAALLEDVYEGLINE